MTDSRIIDPELIETLVRRRGAMCIPDIAAALRRPESTVRAKVKVMVLDGQLEWTGSCHLRARCYGIPEGK